MEKIVNHKNLDHFYFVLFFYLITFGRRVNINLFLQVQFNVSAVCSCSNYLPQVLLTPVANLPPLSLILVAIYPKDLSINYTCSTSGKICCRCRFFIYRWCTLTCKYPREFLTKEIEMTLMLFSRLGGR